MKIIETLLTQIKFNSVSNLALVLIVVIIVSLIWLVTLTIINFRSFFWLKRVFGKSRKEDIKDILREHIERVGVVQIKLNDVETLLHELQRSSQNHIQRLGMVRFNPFEDTGGDQSFVLAILDAKGDGLVISSLHGRERTRIYAKSVKAGQSKHYPLSDEEKEAIRQAQLKTEEN